MINIKAELAAKELKERFSAMTELSRLIVFGSCARGDATNESDLDIYIEVPELIPELRQKISEIAWEISLENGLVISTIVASRNDVEKGIFGANPILEAITSQGIVI